MVSCLLAQRLCFVWEMQRTVPKAFKCSQKKEKVWEGMTVVVLVVVKKVGSEIGKTQVQIPASLSSSIEASNKLLHLLKPTFPQLSKGNETVTMSQESALRWCSKVPNQRRCSVNVSNNCKHTLLLSLGKGRVTEGAYAEYPWWERDQNQGKDGRSNC